MNRYISLVVSLQNGRPSISLPCFQSRMRNQLRYSPTVPISLKLQESSLFFSMVGYHMSTFCSSIFTVRGYFNSLADMECTSHTLLLYSFCSCIPSSHPGSCKHAIRQSVLHRQFIIWILHCSTIRYDGNGNHG